MDEMRRTIARVLVSLGITLGVAYFALWACAPAATVRPDLPMRAGQSVGVGLSGTAALVNRDSCKDVLLLGQSGACGAGQFWVHVEPSEWFQFGVVAFAGGASGLGAGPYARFRLVTEPNVRAALDVSAGLAWAAVGLPLALRISDQWWVYTEPSLGMRVFNAGRLPIGLAVDLGFARVHAELGAGTGSRDLQLRPEDIMGYGSAGVEFTF